SRGLRQFGFVGWSPADDSLWESQRVDAFTSAIRAAGFPTAVYPWPALPWGREQKRLARWLPPLPRPARIFASHAQRARHVLAAPRLAGLGVPDELAVVGVDNDETFCELSTPSISSIALDTDAIGYQGADMLDRLMRGRRAPRSAV